MKKISICLTLLTTLLWIVEVQAEACTYNEALLAINKGNLIRGLALMKMAAKDGDQRAERYVQQRISIANLGGLEAVDRLPARKRFAQNSVTD